MGTEILRMENITKIYSNGFAANKNVTFSGNAGEIHALCLLYTSRQHQLLVNSVVVCHGDRGDLIPVVTDGDKRDVAGGKQLILSQGAVQTVHCVHRPPLKLAAQQPHGASLLAGADQTGINDRTLVGGQHLRPNPVSTLIDQMCIRDRLYTHTCISGILKAMIFSALEKSA